MRKRETRISRRRFLTASFAGLSSAGLAGMLPSTAHAYGDFYGPPGPDRRPVVRTLGRTGIRVPIVGVGTGAASDGALLAACYDMGMRLFDTSSDYRQGRHEELLGRTFQQMGVRDEVIILTKISAPRARGGLPSESIRRQLDGSLRRLQSDYVDIFMVADVSDRGVILDPTIMEALSALKEQGKARAIGVATHSRMAASIEAAIESQIYDVILTSINFTMADDDRLLTAIENAAAQGIGVIAMKTQAGGQGFPHPSSLRDFNSNVINSAALKWACQNESIAAAIPGFDKYDHLHLNFAVALNPKYTYEEKRFLANEQIRLGFEFCRQCRSCLAACPRGVEVPMLMRTHMYARQYADFERARRALDSMDAGYGLVTCASCEACTARCVNSVNIPRKIEELKLLYA